MEKKVIVYTNPEEELIALREEINSLQVEITDLNYVIEDKDNEIDGCLSIKNMVISELNKEIKELKEGIRR